VREAQCCIALALANREGVAKWVLAELRTFRV
jgi:hypothetical protein